MILSLKSTLIIILMSFQLSPLLYATTDSKKIMACYNSFYYQFPFAEEMLGKSIEVIGSKGTSAMITLQGPEGLVKVTNLEGHKPLSPYRFWHFGINTEFFDLGLGNGYYVISTPQYTYHGDFHDEYEWEVVDDGRKWEVVKPIEPVQALSETNINAQVYIDNAGLITIVDIDTEKLISPTLGRRGIIFKYYKNNEVFTLPDGRQIKAVKVNDYWDWELI